MRTEQLFLRCYAKQIAEGQWYAMCIDLNIDAEAATLQAVKFSLEDAILGYLETVTDTDNRSSLEILLRRPASLSHQLFYYFAKYVTRIHRIVNSHAFEEPVPIRLALSS
ncbi:MAG: hypothetical protein OXF97_09295 [Nitrospira sp.]|nr:hypothetical protein [Nitrospira sp.]